MWLLSVIPESFIYLLTIMGVGGVILASIPISLPLPVAKYRKIFLIICLLSMSMGLFLQGARAEQKNWLTKVAQMEAKIATLESEAGKVTTKIVIEYVDRVKTVRVKGDTIIKEIPIYITKESDEKCVIPNGFVALHDRAALNTIIETELR